MAKAPSDATRLRTTQRELRDNYTLLTNARNEREQWLSEYRRYNYTLLTNARNERDHYRARATKAEQEVAEWRARFDALLARTPKEE